MGCVKSTTLSKDPKKDDITKSVKLSSRNKRLERLDGRKKSQKTMDKIEENVAITSYKLDEVS